MTVAATLYSDVFAVLLEQWLWQPPYTVYKGSTWIESTSKGTNVDMATFTWCNVFWEFSLVLVSNESFSCSELGSGRVLLRRSGRGKPDSLGQLGLTAENEEVRCLVNLLMRTHGTNVCRVLGYLTLTTAIYGRKFLNSRHIIMIRVIAQLRNWHS